MTDMEKRVMMRLCVKILTETEDCEVVETIRPVGYGGCYALYFIVADIGRKCYNRKHDLRYGR